MKNKATGLIPVFLFLIFLEFAPGLMNIPDYLFPPLSKVLTTACSRINEISTALLFSLKRVIAGLVLGSLFGILLGIIMGCNRFFEGMFHPIFSLLYPVPALAWAPVFSIWFGIGELLPVMLIFVCSFIPVMYSTISGIKSIDQDLIDVARSLGTGKIRLLTRLIIPLAMPAIIMGLRIEAGMAWKVVFAAELVAIPSGIGALMAKSESLIDMPMIFACMSVLGIMCFIFEKLFMLFPQRNQMNKDAIF